ncbi:hypothetical protein [Scytonema sp. NUACC26]|uniref:hypothetical protein n=1 Tax=Scytonema sp. NUACC26 TaxID=3140176 RepID=UPI0038B24D81
MKAEGRSTIRLSSEARERSHDGAFRYYRKRRDRSWVVISGFNGKTPAIKSQGENENPTLSIKV